MKGEDKQCELTGWRSRLQSRQKNETWCGSPGSSWTDVWLPGPPTETSTTFWYIHADRQLYLTPIDYVLALRRVAAELLTEYLTKFLAKYMYLSKYLTKHLTKFLVKYLSI